MSFYKFTKEYGAKDGSQRGRKKGGKGRNKTTPCRHPKTNKKHEEKK